MVDVWVVKGARDSLSSSQNGTHVVRRGKTNLAPPSTLDLRQAQSTYRGQTAGALCGGEQHHQAKREIAAALTTD